MNTFEQIESQFNRCPETQCRIKRKYCFTWQVSITISNLYNILQNDLHLTAYKIQFTQELKPVDHEVSTVC